MELVATRRSPASVANAISRVLPRLDYVEGRVSIPPRRRLLGHRGRSLFLIPPLPFTRATLPV